MKYKELSKYPSVKKDLAVIINKNVTAQEIATLIKNQQDHYYLTQKYLTYIQEKE